MNETILEVIADLKKENNRLKEQLEEKEKRDSEDRCKYCKETKRLRTIIGDISNTVYAKTYGI